MDLGGMDWGAVLVAGILSGGLGAAWYSPALLGNAWMAALGKTADQLGPAGPAMAGSMISCLVAAASIEWLTTAAGVDSLLGGAGLGAVVGLGVVAMTMLSDSLFSGWGWTLYLIQTGYRATYLVITGAICGAWPW